jgi:4-amino-4-deoxy-L-arabinose transferase-like glycosyltransferase
VDAGTNKESTTWIFPSWLSRMDSEPKSGKTIFLGVIALAIYAAVRNLALTAARPLWFDELLTQTVSNQPTLSAIWSALENGVDGNPPLFYLIERVASRLVSNEMVGFRLPSILGFSCTLICLFVFMRKRSGTRAAFICVLLLFITPLSTSYAVEARPYSLLVACLSVALVCYQRLPAWPWTMGLLLSLSFAESLHYYAVLACFPFFAAEVFYLYSKGRFRGWIWFSMLASLIPAALSMPLLLRMKQAFGTHFWARPELMVIPNSYGVFFRLNAMWGIAVAVVALLVMISVLARNRMQQGAGSGNAIPEAPEHVLVMGFIGLPVLGVIAARIGHGGATDRYYLPAILGVLVAFAYVLKHLMPVGFNLFAAFILVAVVSQEAYFLRSVLRSPGGRIDRAGFLLPLLEASNRNDLPVVISDATQYVELSHDARPRLNLRMVAVVDPSSAVVYVGTDSVDRTLMGLWSCTQLQIYEFNAFVAIHPVFLLYSDGAGYDWWPRRLLHDGATLDVVAMQGGGILYLVELKLDVREKR